MNKRIARKIAKHYHWEGYTWGANYPYHLVKKAYAYLNIIPGSGLQIKAIGIKEPEHRIWNFEKGYRKYCKAFRKRIEHFTDGLKKPFWYMQENNSWTVSVPKDNESPIVKCEMKKQILVHYQSASNYEITSGPHMLSFLDPKMRCDNQYQFRKIVFGLEHAIGDVIANAGFYHYSEEFAANAVAINTVLFKGKGKYILLQDPSYPEITESIFVQYGNYLFDACQELKLKTFPPDRMIETTETFLLELAAGSQHSLNEKITELTKQLNYFNREYKLGLEL